MTNEPKTSDFDWRFQASISGLGNELTYNGTILNDEARLTVVVPVRIARKRTLTLPIPNATALCLDRSNAAFSQSAILRENAHIDTSIKPDVTFPLGADAMEYFALRLESVVLAVIAIEAFVNESVPDGFTYVSQQGRTSTTVTRAKTDIERFVSLDEKLATVLPAALAPCPTPKGRSPWAPYLRLRKLRDRLVHLKTEDRAALWPELASVWSDLVLCPEPARTAKAVIDHFIPYLPKRPDWHSLYPYGR